MRRKLWKAILSLVLSSIILVCLNKITAESEQDKIVSGNIVVAGLGSNNISYSDICVSTETLKKMREEGYSEERLLEWRKEIESSRLIRHLEHLILSEAIEQYDVHVSDEEIDVEVAKRLEKLYGKRVFCEEDAKRQNETIREVLQLLETWQEDESMAEALYQSHFSERMALRQWEQLKKQYSTRDDLENLRVHLPVVDAHAVNKIFRESVINELSKEHLLKKLKAAGEITKNDTYSDWLNKKVSQTRILRPDLVPFTIKSKATPLGKEITPQPLIDAESVPEGSTPGTE